MKRIISDKGNVFEKYEKEQPIAFLSAVLFVCKKGMLIDPVLIHVNKNLIKYEKVRVADSLT